MPYFYIFYYWIAGSEKFLWVLDLFRRVVKQHTLHTFSHAFLPTPISKNYKQHYSNFSIKWVLKCLGFVGGSEWVFGGSWWSEPHHTWPTNTKHNTRTPKHLTHLLSIISNYTQNPQYQILTNTNLAISSNLESMCTLGPASRYIGSHSKETIKTYHET